MQQIQHTIETDPAAIRATLSGMRTGPHCAKSVETFGAAAGGPDSRQDKILALVDHALRAAETTGQKGAYLHLHAPGEFRYTVAATDKKRLNALRKGLAAATTRKRAPRAGDTNGSGRLHYGAPQNARTVDSQIVDLLSGDCGEPRRQREANALAALLAHYDKVPADKRKMTVVWVHCKDQTAVPFFRVEGKTWAADDFGFCVGVTLGDGISGSLKWCAMVPTVPGHIANCSRSAPAVRKALEESATRNRGNRTHEELVEFVRARYATDEKGRNAREVQTRLTLQAVDQYPDIPLGDLAELAEFTSLEECEAAAFEAMMDATGEDE